jgi:hypothetical protein
MMPREVLGQSKMTMEPGSGRSHEWISVVERILGNIPELFFSWKSECAHPRSISQALAALGCNRKPVLSPGHAKHKRGIVQAAVETEQGRVDESCMLCLKHAVGPVNMTEDVKFWA